MPSNDFSEKPDKKSDSAKKPKQTPCESCAYYDAVDEDGTLGCTVDFDEDELYILESSRGSCPYYKYYDEYKFVRTQN